MTAVQLPENAAEAIECKELWSGELTGEFFASPLVHAGRLYMVDKAGKYYVVDAATGKTVLDKKLEFAAASGGEGASVYPSPCLAGKRIFLGNDAGAAVVLEPGDDGLAVGSGLLSGGSGATPAFDGRRMLARGGKLLYCLAAP
jgi:outer membrane protein assembly factor BamB